MTREKKDVTIGWVSIEYSNQYHKAIPFGWMDANNDANISVSRCCSFFLIKWEEKERMKSQ